MKNERTSRGIFAVTLTPGGRADEVPFRTAVMGKMTMHAIEKRPRLTVGMAGVGDQAHTLSALHALRMSQADVWDELEILVFVDAANTSSTDDLPRLIASWHPQARLLTAAEGRNAGAVIDLLFQEAAGDAVLWIAPQVLLAPGALRQLLNLYAARPDCLDLLHGPQLDSQHRLVATHLEPVWSNGMFGVNAVDSHGIDPRSPPFEIALHRCQLFSCHRAAWPQLGIDFREVGGIAGYLHDQFRLAGHRILCLPALRWMSQEESRSGLSDLSRQDYLRDVLLGRRALNQPYDDVLEQLSPRMTQGEIDQVLTELGLPSLIEHWFSPAAANAVAPAILCDGDTDRSSAENRDCRSSKSAEIQMLRRMPPCFSWTIRPPRTLAVAGAVLTAETISTVPGVEVLHNVLSELEAGQIISRVAPEMSPSYIHGTGSRPVTDYRTTYSATFSRDQSQFAETVYQRLAAICECPVEHLEPLQIVRYHPGQFLVEHYDFVRPDMELYRYGGQRLKTLLVYLNDIPPDEPGGCTMFPRLHLQIRCSLGTALMWRNVDSAGNLEPLTLHAGIAPIHSTKFVLVCFQREAVAAACPIPAAA